MISNIGYGYNNLNDRAIDNVLYFSIVYFRWYI